MWYLPTPVLRIERLKAVSLPSFSKTSVTDAVRFSSPVSAVER